VADDGGDRSGGESYWSATTGPYTFITRLAEVPADGLVGGASTLLLIFGIVSAVGVAAAGRSTTTPLVLW
jgi:hypothetical protein